MKRLRSACVEMLELLSAYTRTDIKYLTKGSFWVTANYGVQVGTGIITTIALANLLPKETLGAYQFVLSVAAIVSVLTLSGLGTAITRAVAKGHDGTLRSGFRKKLNWSIAITASSGAIAAYYFLMGDSKFGIAFLVVGAFAPFIESFKLYENYLFGKEAFRDTLILGFWRKPIPLTAILVALYFSDSLITLLFAYFGANAISYGLVYNAVLKKFKPPIETHIETVAFGKHLSILRIIQQVGQHTDKILIWHFIGSVAVAGFTIAQLAVRYSGGLVGSLSTLILPRIARRDLPTLQQTLPRKVLLFTFVMVVAAALIIIIIPFIFPVLFPEYPESIPYAQLLAITLAFTPRGVFTKALVGHVCVKQQYFATVFTTIVKITLLLILLPLYGVWGAIYAILITEAASFCMLYILFRTAHVNN